MRASHRLDQRCVWYTIRIPMETGIGRLESKREEILLQSCLAYTLSLTDETLINLYEQ